MIVAGRLQWHADQPHEPLREHAVQRRHELVRLDAHVEEASEHVHDVVRVDGREHQMAGQRRLDRDLRRLGVADLADHDLVGVVPQDRAQAARERQALLLVDRDLRDALQLILDRILDRDDLVFDRLDLRERRVERRRLAAAGRPGHEHHAVRLGDVLAEPAQLELREPQDVEAQLGELLADRFLVEDADDRVLAVDARHDRDAEVDGLARHAQLEPAVLRHALLGDVELGHDLDARDDRRCGTASAATASPAAARRRSGISRGRHRPASRCECRWPAAAAPRRSSSRPAG